MEVAVDGSSVRDGRNRSSMYSTSSISPPRGSTKSPRLASVWALASHDFVFKGGEVAVPHPRYFLDAVAGTLPPERGALALPGDFVRTLLQPPVFYVACHVRCQSTGCLC